MKPDARAAIVERVDRMTPAERAAFAEQTEAELGHKPVTHRGLFAIVREILGTVSVTKGEIETRVAALDARVRELEARPQLRYLGVFADDGRTYVPGDCVTFGGSMWIARETTSARPDESPAGARVWTLCVKRGREGRPRKDGKS